MENNSVVAYFKGVCLLSEGTYKSKTTEAVLIEEISGNISPIVK
jgi:hypothetical protein